MKLKMLSAALALGCSLVAGNVAAIIVGGVDFGPLGNPPGTHLETTTLAETVVLADGQVLTGYGQVNTVNGNINYATNPGDRLYFTFTNYVTQNFGPTSTEFSGGTISIYIGPTFNLLDLDSPANVAIIQSPPYALWATLAGHGNLGGGASANATLVADGTLVGATLSFTGQGLLDVTGGLADVVALLDSNWIPDAAGGFADIELGTSANNDVPNPNDILNGFCSEIPQAGDWCLEGSADLRGHTAGVPEPSILALVGMGLLAAGVARRKARKA